MAVTSLDGHALEPTVLEPTTCIISSEARNHYQLSIPFGGHGPLRIEMPVPMSEQEWDYVLSVLIAMKPGIVR